MAARIHPAPLDRCGAIAEINQGNSTDWSLDGPSFPLASNSNDEPPTVRGLGRGMYRNDLSDTAARDLPFATTLPTAMIGTFGLGLLVRDGLLMISGFVMSILATIGVLWFLIGWKRMSVTRRQTAGSETVGSGRRRPYITDLHCL